MSKRRRYKGAVAPASEAGVSQERQAEPRIEGEYSAAVDDRGAVRGVDSAEYSYPIEVDGVGVVLPKDPF
jgi:hypothetical protein